MANQGAAICPNIYKYDFTQADKVLGACLSHSTLSSTITSYGRFFIDDWEIANSFGQMLEPLQADLVDIALFVYLVDRLSRRSKRVNPNYQFLWARRLQLKIPVRCLGV